MSKIFSLGIDLGTSNSAIAITPVQENAAPRVLDITQVMGPNSVGEKSTLASALYLPHPNEFAEGSFALPWQDGHLGNRLVGEFARAHGALVPERLVMSAKSWLCNPHVDRQAPILPWKSEIAEQKVSPLEASQLYVEHLKHAAITAARNSGLDATVENTQVVLTVPASFDEVARSLTSQAATAAGFDQVILLEEPQAAFYAWLAQAGSDWRERVHPGDIVLVCDVGGGTADFSLIVVSETGGNLQLERVSVGDHILLGGDNLDLALAFALRAQMEESGQNIDDWQFRSLVHGCRLAKERLFSDNALDEAPISLPARGSSLFAKTLSVRLPRALLEAIALDGFLALTPVTEMPVQQTSLGLKEFGLHYASDPVLSKHLAQFLTRSLTNVKSNPELTALVERAGGLGDTFVRPTAVLFNGGFFKADAMRKRVLDLLAQWNGGQPVRELEGGQYDLAVAIGASYYGMSHLTGKGIRIKAGTARSYYLGLETSMLAVPGFRPPVKGLCVVPQGMEEGTEEILPDRKFGLVTGEEVEFRFFSSSVRAGDKMGTIVPNAERDLDETSRLKVTLPPLGDQTPAGDILPVELHARVTELGSLELWMQHAASGQRWKLEFKVRTQ